MAVSLRDERYQWLALVLYAVAAFLVAVALVFGARWVYRSIHHSSPAPVKEPVSTTQEPEESASNNSSSAGNNPSQSSNSSSSNSENQNLPNNGPGDVAAIFLGTSAVAAGLHYVYRARRLPS